MVLKREKWEKWHTNELSGIKNRKDAMDIERIKLWTTLSQ